ncbi:MAG: tRNA (adenosine(37)-N6)-threonylcarbamoyltransferase complex ATPase subunit type 1 TsaE [bacterium]|nr:tRNA (adenosine(37)-N6)-threonylcarbamoyltransferase complex ATPase subunit type 1 TsaE [bacterium]
MAREISEYLTHAARETIDLGIALSRTLNRGDCVALRGDLGSGKTCLVQGICKGLSVSDDVTSPTFVLINEYEGVGQDGRAMAVYHFDLYRLAGPEELFGLGCDDYFYGTGICLIEWANLGGDLIPAEAIDISMVHVGDSQRKVTISGRAM